MNVILDNLTLFCYILSTLFHWLLMASRKHTLLPYAVGAACLGFLLHTGYLSLEAARVGSLLFSEAQGATAFFSWTVVLAYLIAEAATRIRALGSFLLPMALFTLLLGVAIPQDLPQFLPPLTSFWQITHVVLASLGLAAFALTFCGGIMYLIQDSYLKAKQPGGFSARLPSLEMLDRLNFWALAFGLPLLTQGIYRPLVPGVARKAGGGGGDHGVLRGELQLPDTYPRLRQTGLVAPGMHTPSQVEGSRYDDGDYYRRSEPQNDPY
jgi:ABC-type uncharacterized transport system permease subunit